MSTGIYVHPTAKVGERFVPAPFSVIDDDVVIGDDVHVGSFVHICSGARIGAGSAIGDHVTICADAKLGDGCVISDFAMIGRRPKLSPTSTAKAGELKGLSMGDGCSVGSHTVLMAGSTFGKGCVVGTSQVQSLLWLQLQGVGLAATTGQRMERFAPDATTNPLFTVYPTSNGWLAIACLRADHWRALAAAMGLDWMLEDPRFARFGDLIRNRDEFRPLFSEHLATNTTDHWWQILRNAGIWSSPVRRLEELANDEHVLANEYLVTYDDGFVGPPAPFEIDGYRGARGLAAEYSEHTDEILSELGYSEDEIVVLRADSAIW